MMDNGWTPRRQVPVTLLDERTLGSPEDGGLLRLIMRGLVLLGLILILLLLWGMAYPFALFGAFDGVIWPPGLGPDKACHKHDEALTPFIYVWLLTLIALPCVPTLPRGSRWPLVLALAASLLTLHGTRHVVAAALMPCGALEARQWVEARGGKIPDYIRRHHPTMVSWIEGSPMPSGSLTAEEYRHEFGSLDAAAQLERIRELLRDTK